MEVKTKDVEISAAREITFVSQQIAF